MLFEEINGKPAKGEIISTSLGFWNFIKVK